jgi:hypothetical protein
MQVVDDLPAYLAPVLNPNSNARRRRAIIAAARSLQAFPLDLALLMAKRAFDTAPDFTDRREASAVGWLLLHPTYLTDLEMVE